MSTNQVALIFAVGTAGMLFMAAAIIIFVSFYQKKMIKEEMRRQAMEVDYQKRMLQAALESQENERNRVSKDLHDNIGMMLMTVRTQLNSLIGKQLSESVAGDLRQLVDETHDSVRRLSWDLKPGTLERFGLVQTIGEMCRRLNSGSSVPVELVESGKVGVLDKTQETLLFRIVQESVSNAIRHAEATLIRVKFNWEERSLALTIADDGIGFEFPTKRDAMKIQLGLGLINLENRATLLHGELSFEKNKPTGTIVRLTVPIKNHG